MAIIKDRVVEQLVVKLLQRSSVGLEKYGVGLDREDLSSQQWLIHLQEELLDAAGYVEAMLNTEEEKWLFVQGASFGWYYIPEKLHAEFQKWYLQMLREFVAEEAGRFDVYKCEHPSSYRFKLQPESLNG